MTTRSTRTRTKTPARKPPTPDQLAEARETHARLDYRARVAARQRASWADEYRAEADEAAARLADLEGQAVSTKEVAG